MNSQSTPIAAPGSMCGANAIVRTSPVKRSFCASSRPIASPPTRVPTTATSTNRAVLLSASISIEPGWNSST